MTLIKTFLGFTATLALAACTTTGDSEHTNNIQNIHNHYYAQSEPAADAETVAAIDAALEGVYAVISGPVGQERDFDKMRALFTPDAQLNAITPNGLSGGSVEKYIVLSGPFLVQMGFTERQLDRRLEVYGNLAHAWSSYEGTFTQADGSRGQVQGINSFQLVRQDDGSWLVQSILWQQGTPDFPLPDDLNGE